MSIAAQTSYWQWLDQITWWQFIAAVAFLTYATALFSVPSVLLQREGRPQSALSWVLVLFTLPVVGLFLWWAIGRKHLDRRRRKRRRAAEKISSRVHVLRAQLHSPPQPDWELLPLKRLPAEAAEWAFPPTEGNEVRILLDAHEAYPAIEQMIRDASEHIHVLFYIWQADSTGKRFRDLLVEKAQQGVTVRVLLDAVGASGAGGHFMQPLRKAGGKVAFFAPPALLRRSLELNFRNHRKIVVCDGRVAFIGELNIGNEYGLHWRDTGLELSGPVVDQLQEVFLDDWHFTTKEDFTAPSYFSNWQIDHRQSPPTNPAVCGIVASGPHAEMNLVHEAFFMAINSATERVYITTPYFVPDQTILAALRSAAFRGVDVRIMVPAQSDSLLVSLASRSYYAGLLKTGTRIYEYCDGVLHSKTAIFDDNLAIVGSANMDIRSFRLNFEINCVVNNRPFTSQLAEIFARDLALSTEITLHDVEATSYAARLTYAVAHLLSPLL